MRKPTINFDSLDYEIVRLLSDDPHLTNKALAAKLDLAESTCAYRVRRLHGSGAMSPPRLELDHALLGYGLQAIITVYMSSHSRQAVDHFMETMAAAPNVLQVVHLTGRSDFMVTVAVAGREQLKDFVLDHVTVHPAVRGTETHVVFDSRRGSWVPSTPSGGAEGG